MQNYIVYMQFIIQMGDPFTLLGLFSLKTSVMDFLLLMAAISFSQNHSLQILIYKFNPLRMKGLPSILVLCCKTIYFNSLNKVHHLIIYTFHKKIIIF